MSAARETCVPFEKTHQHCKSPGCRELATFYVHKNIVGFCDKHWMPLIAQTIKAIVNGTHHELINTGR